MQSTQEPMTCETPESEAPPTNDLEDEEWKNIWEDNGWCTGSISWFNDKMQKLRVVFEDDTDDYIYTEDIVGVEITLIWLRVYDF